MKRNNWMVWLLVATMTILLSACGGGGTNHTPVANAGADQTVATGSTVTLDGTASSDEDNDTLTYTWTLSSKPSGSSAALSSATAPKPSFTTDKDGVYIVSLVVNDGTIDSAADTVKITATISNHTPVANAGADQTVKRGVSVTLDGTGSTDADGDSLDYTWTLTVPTGSAATLSNPNAKQPTFVVDVAGAYVAQLVVNDGTADSAPDTVTITADVFIDLSNFQAANVVIGQPQLNTTIWADTNPPQQNNFSTSLYSNPIVINGTLYLADFDWNRVLGFNSVPSVNGSDADFVLGQADFASKASGNGKDTMNEPQTMATANGKFFVVDYGNDQVLAYNSIPTATGDQPDYVIGQANFGNDDTSCTDKRLDTPENIYAVNGKLLIADSGHNRVLIYNTIPSGSDASADLVLGQTDFTHCSANGGGGSTPSASSLNYPAGIWSDGTHLVVNDDDNNRVLIWNTFPTYNGQPADIVLGQNAFNMDASNDDNQDGTSDATPSARTLSDPYNGVYSNGKQLFVVDKGNNRVLIWNTFPTTNFQPADVVLGQNSFDMLASNDDDQDGASDATPSARTFDNPDGVFQYQDQLLITDMDNGRILIFNGQ